MKKWLIADCIFDKFLILVFVFTNAYIFSIYPHWNYACGKFFAMTLLVIYYFMWKSDENDDNTGTGLREKNKGVN